MGAARIIAFVKQLVLDLIPAPLPNFDNWVAGGNSEARKALFDATFNSPAAKVIYLWGVAGSGKSHALAAVVAGWQQRADFSPEDAPVMVVDDVGRMDDGQQVALFNAINQRSLVAGSCVIAAGNTAPRDLPLRPELTSRLGSGLVFQLLPLTDAEKALALNAHALSRGFKLSADVSGYLLRHSRRDMASLIAMLDALDQYSLETGREITVPLLKQLSQPALI